MRQFFHRQAVRSVAAAVALVACAGGASTVAGAAPRTAVAHASGVWNRASEVPGIRALNAGGYAEITAMSCAADGDCSAGGDYRDVLHSTRAQSFVVDEVNGRWGMATQVPGIPALNAGAYSLVTSLSCASAGDCSVGGGYLDGAGHYQAFIADEVAGVWHAAMEVPGTAVLNVGGSASVKTVSCPTSGNCTAAGHYVDASRHQQAFVVDEVAGTWQSAIEVPGSAALNIDGHAEVLAVSCPAPGQCAAGGTYKDGKARFQAFVADEVAGTWQSAIEVPGTAALNAGSLAAVTVLSCASVGNCSAGGDYRDAQLHTQAYFASEVNGTWHSAAEGPGTAALNARGDAIVYALSCAAPGSCAAGGSYADHTGAIQSFVIDQAAGSWHRAIELPGSAALNVEGSGEGVATISCSAPGTCSAGGDYQDSHGNSPIYVANEVGGAWGKAVQVPGSAALDTGGSASLNAISCAPRTGSCSGGGNYRETSSHFEPFVVGYTPAPVVTSLTPASGRLRGGTVTIIRGLHLRAAAVVLFGSRRATGVRVLSATEVRATAPAGVGTVDVRVSTPGGISDATARDKFAYAGAPTVIGLAPARGSSKGGARVEVHGTYLAGVTIVLFGSRRATHIHVVSARIIRVTVPPGGGRVNVRVVTPEGISAVSARDRFTYHA